jgi:hypothetical protein
VLTEYTKTDLVFGFTGNQILVAVILAQIYLGFYGSISEVVREALRLHRKYERLYLRDLHKELKLAADQIDSDQTEPHDMKEIIDRVNAKRLRRK